MKLEELKQKLIDALKAARAIAKGAEDAERDLTGEERGNITKALEDARGLRKQIGDLQKDADLVDEINKLEEGIELAKGAESAAERIAAKPAADRKRISEQFVDHPAVKAWMKSLAPNGRIPDEMKFGSSPVIEFKTLLTGGGSGSAGELVIPEQAPLVPKGRRPLRLRDVVTQGTTSSDTIEFARILAETNAAAMVAEATATGDASGAKPESAFTFERVSTGVKTVAHWIPATKRALSDVGQLRTLIDSFLEDGLEQKLEDQMAAGDASGENFDGIGHMSGTQSQAFDTDLFTTTRKARTKVVTVGRAIPQAYLFNPTDWELIQLQQNNNGDYYYGGPAQQGPETHWRLPVIEVEAIPAGTAYVGDFRKCVLADREAANISVSDSHSDFFIRNMVAILAELRAAFYCIQPSAIVEIALS